jgi:hypothetical protein
MEHHIDREGIGIRIRDESGNSRSGDNSGDSSICSTGTKE